MMSRPVRLGVSLLNSRLLKDYASKPWDEAGIDLRTGQAIDAILAIWPVPPGHKVQIQRAQTDTSVTVEIADLIGAGHLVPGQLLYPNSGKYGGHFGTILSDGRIEVEGKVFDSPSGAASFVRKKPSKGWYFWRLEPNGRRSLRDARAEYLRVVSPEEAEEDDNSAAELA
jgi:hypothetical protein